MSWITIDFFDKGIEQARLTEFVLLRYRKIHIGIDVIWWGRALFSKYTEWTLKSELIGGDSQIRVKFTLQFMSPIMPIVTPVI